MADIVIHRARRIVTLEAATPQAEAVAVADGRILAVGSFGEVRRLIGDRPHRIDDTFADHVLVPGLIDQHLHPLLGATTLATEVIAIEDWVLPERTFPAAEDPETYDRLLTEAAARLADPDEWLVSWGYHELWHGPLDRQRLDRLAGERPTAVWQRSCHSIHLNSAAIEALGLTPEWLAGKGPAGRHVDLDTGHCWETGFFNLVMPKMAPILVSPERITRGLHQLVAYLHQHGVTAVNEPGIIWSMEPWELYQQILGADEVPFSTTFLVDGRTQAARGIPADEAVADALAQIDRVADTSSDKVHLLPGQVKLFADGAIIAQLMQMNEPYLDDEGRPDPDHHGAWIMEPDVLAAYFRAYWQAGWQIHTHVNGDRGLEVLLGIIEDAMIDRPRSDHRSVIVHFANSTEAQIDRIARLGAIVSANPYYPVGFADRYSAHGLGPERADSMVRSRSVLDRGVSLSFHSDLPMAPAQPLALMRYAVTRTTPSGRVAGPEQRIGVDEALRAVTIEAAYSWRAENEIGSIAPGKQATFTVLDRDPHDVEGAELTDIEVLGIVFRGQWRPVPEELRVGASPVALAGSCGLGRAGDEQDHAEGAGSCSCEVARRLAHLAADQAGVPRAA